MRNLSTFTNLLLRTRMKAMLVLVMGLCSAGFAFGQLAMTRSTFTGTFTAITTGPGGATAGTATGDDVTQDNLPIGFSFNYLGTAYTTLGVSSNGWGSFVGALGGSVQNTNPNLYSTTGPNLSLGPWWDDLTTDSICYKTTGTVGSQVFTVQWNSKTYFTGSTERISFQIKLYEGTNVIEFHYGPYVSGAPSTSESASIGIEGATGGGGNFLDAVTGSAFAGMYYITAATEWPSNTNFYRFTPGAPTPLAGGTYNVGAGQTYTRLSEAVAQLNHRGITGPVVLNLTDAQYDVTPANGDNFFPIVFGPISGASLVNNVQVTKASGYAILTDPGAATGGIASPATTTANSTTSEPIIGLCGASFIGLQHLDLRTTAAGVVDRGISVVNNTAVLGSSNNAFNDIKVTLNRGNTSSIGLETRTATTPTAASGANNNNIFTDLQISNCYSGIFLLGTAAFPDLGNQITSSSPTLFNTIGAAATPNDIGNGASLTYGIRISSQSGCTVNNNFVQNVTTTAAVTTDGILCELGQGTNSIFRNKIQNIKNTSTTSTSFITGIRANLATTGTHSLRVYNNFVSGIISGYTGAASATRVIKGIFVQSAGSGVATETINVDFNSVSIDGSAAPNVSSAAFEIGTASGPVINARNNVLSNGTITQTAPAAHYAWASTSATATGNTGSVSNYNDLYVPNATQGFTGIGNITTYATLANWQTGVTQDANSVACDPGFTNSLSDLHVGGLCLNAVGNATGISWVTSDIDNQARAGTPDIGADEYVPSTLDAGVTLMTAPVQGGCFTAAQPVTVTLKNFGLVAINFAVNPVTVTVNVTGAITTSINTVLNSGSLAASATQAVTVGNINMSTAGTYTFNALSTVTGDQNAANDAMTAVSITNQPGSLTLNRTSVCAGDSVQISLAGNTSSSFQLQYSYDNGLTWTNVPGGTVSPRYFTPGDSVMFRSQMCGTLNSANTAVVNWNPVTSPTVTNDTVCGLDSLHLMASGLGTINWYANLSGGSYVHQGPTYDVVSPTTVTYYVSNISGQGAVNVGPPNNLIGAGAQQTSTNYEIFDVLQNVTLSGAYVYPGAAGNVVCNLINSAGTILQTATVPVSAADINNRTYIPLNFVLTPGTNYRLAQGTGSVSMFRNSGGVVYPYSNAYVSITGSAAGASFYYFFYDWQLLAGCESPRVAVTGVVNPAAAITASAAVSPVCAQDTIQLSVASSNSGYSYTWTPGGSLITTTGANVSGVATTSMSYYVDAIDSAGCLNKDTVAVVVNAHPVGIFTSSDSLICIGDTVTMGILPVPPFFSDSTVVPILDNTPAGSYGNIVVSGYPGVLGTNSIARVCLDANHTWDSDLSLTLISPTGTQFDLSSNNGGSLDNYTNTCFDMTAGTNITAGAAPFTGSFVPEGAAGFATFAGQSANGTWQLWMVDNVGGDFGQLNWWTISFNSTPTTYSWSSNPSGFTATTPQVSVSPSVTTDYMLTIADSTTGCDTTYSFTLNVNPPLSVSASGPALVCAAGSSVTLTAVATGGNGAFLYDWNGLGSLDSLVVTINSDTSFVVNVLDTCSTPGASDTVTITLAQPLQVSVTGDSAICAGTSDVLNAVTSGGDGNPSFAWSNGPTTSSNTVSPAGTQIYTISVTDGCNIAPVSSSFLVTVDPLAVAGFTSAITGNLSYAFTNGSTNATSYLWTFGDGGTSTSASPTHTYTAGGNYTVCLTATNNCGSDSSCTNLTVVANAVPFGNGELQLWPNPNSGSFNVRLNGLTGSDIRMQLYSTSGQLVLDRAFPAVFDTLEENFETQTSKGVYYLRITDGVHNASVKVTIQ